MSARLAPPAMRICACTRSTPVTSSVHVCSTCAQRAAPNQAKSGSFITVDMHGGHCGMHQPLAC
jgi:hypothetical protein